MRIFAVDIEASGQFPAENFVTQIGMCCVESTLFDPANVKASIVSTFSTYLPQPEGKGWEERSVNEFWLKNPVIYDETLAGIKTAGNEGIVRMLAWIDEHKDPNPEQNLLISDNSAFDFVFLSKVLEPYHRSLLYLFGAYEQTPIDVSSFYLGVANRNIPKTNTWGSLRAASGTTPAPNYFEELGLTQHDAGSDATVIALHFLRISAGL